MGQALGLLLYQNMLFLKKPSRPPLSRKRDFRSFLREIRLHVCLVCARVRMHEVPRIPCFSASAAMRALSLRAFTRRRSVLLGLSMCICIGVNIMTCSTPMTDSIDGINLLILHTIGNVIY